MSLNYWKELRRKRKEQGLCTRCGAEVQKSGKCVCEECQKKINKLNKDKNKSKQYCVRCKKKFLDGRTCEECKPKVLVAYKKFYHENPERCGLCNDDLSPFNLMTGRRVCEFCLEKIAMKKLL